MAPSTSLPLEDQITHVIFDFDGLLIDTETAYTRANSFMLERYGKEFTMELKRKMMGRKHMESVKWLIEEVGIADKVTPEEYAKDYDAYLDKAYLDACALPGAVKLVEHCSKNGIPIAICTGSCTRTFAIKEQNHKAWTDLVPIKIASGDHPDITHGKPHPEPYLYTMAQFEKQPLAPSNVLVFEDAPNGVESALAAGMKCIMVPDPKVFQPDEAFRARVTKVLHSLEEFVPEEFGLPPYDA